MARKGFSKLANDFYMNGKVRELRAVCPSSLGVLPMVQSYCSDNLTDGRISSRDLKYLIGATEDEIDALRDAGLLDADGDDGYLLHDYLDYQLSKDKILKKRQQDRDYYRSAKSGANDENRDSDEIQCTDSELNPDGIGLNRKNRKNERTERTQEPFIPSGMKEARDPQTTETNHDWPDIDAWEPKQEHYEYMRHRMDQGDPHVDLTDLAKTFKRKIRKYGWEKYPYKDLDAAFYDWIDQEIKQAKEQAKNHPHRPKPIPHVHSSTCDHVKPYVQTLKTAFSTQSPPGRFHDSPYDHAISNFITSLNQGHTGEQALAEVMEGQRNDTKEMIS